MVTQTQPKKKAQNKKVAQATQNGMSNQVTEKSTPIKKEVEAIIRTLAPSAEDRINQQPPEHSFY